VYTEIHYAIKTHTHTHTHCISKQSKYNIQVSMQSSSAPTQYSLFSQN